MFGQRLSILLAALWWGGISGVSFLAVPLIFASLGNPAQAGPVAARLFSWQCWAAWVIGLALLLLLRHQRQTAMRFSVADTLHPAVPQMGHPQPSRGTFGLLLLGMVLALVQEWGVAQSIITARASGGSIRLWHSLGSLMVLGQWLCSGAVLWRLTRAPVR